MMQHDGPLEFTIQLLYPGEPPFSENVAYILVLRFTLRSSRHAAPRVLELPRFSGFS